jgi:four helix bundle protein
MLDLSHKKLDVWKISIQFALSIYKCTEIFPKTEKYGLSNQLRRAAVSVPSDIAEGAARKSKIERKRYFEIARSSIVEIDTQLEIANRLNYLNNENMSMMGDQVNHIFAMLSNLITKS